MNRIQRQETDIIKRVLPQKVVKLSVYTKRRIFKFFKITPTNFYLNLDVSHCGLKCALCPNGGSCVLEGPGKGFMNPTLFKRIVDKFVEENVLVNHIEIGNWGEPLLNPAIHQIIRYAKSNPSFMQKGATVQVNTTLNHLPEPNDFLKSGVDDIRITLSGMTQEIYSRYHRGGNIEKVKSNILKLVQLKNAAKLKNLQIKLIFLNFIYNKKDSELAEKFCRKHDIKFVSNRGRMVCVDCFIEFQEQKEKMSKVYSQFIDLQKEKSYMTAIDSNNVKFCNLRFNRITVNFDGQLFRCCGVFDKRHFLGSIFDFKIKDIPEVESEICKICAKTPMSNGRHIVPFLGR
ncbi:MAG: hypothetical protein JW869_05055 [Candidatus Omnitrophica bacterium]|nr:hypothetical protein [Candidatus Omnitrophota bacterium]